MKILIVGAGSIGSRHAKNIKELDHEIYAVDVNKENLKAVKPFAKKTYTSLREALKDKFDAAFICTYSNDHIPPAISCADAGCHLLDTMAIIVMYHAENEKSRIRTA